MTVQKENTALLATKSDLTYIFQRLAPIRWCLGREKKQIEKKFGRKRRQIEEKFE